MRNTNRLFFAFIATAMLFFVGANTYTTFHDAYDWRAEEFFDDPKVIALCKAVRANDLEQIDRLVADGADVNAKGKGNMTPLLWAFPDNKPERFRRLLEHGANPNVIFQSDFNTEKSVVTPGGSVTHLACRTAFDEYFDCVFEHGGDPNLPRRRDGKVYDSPITLLLGGQAGDRKRKLERLIELGADIEFGKDDDANFGITPVWLAAGRQFDLALVLLEAGADYRRYNRGTKERLIHFLAGVGERHYPDQFSEKQQVDYRKLVSWLEERGESLETAKADLARWREWRDNGREDLIERDYRERIAKERAAAEGRVEHETAELGFHEKYGWKAEEFFDDPKVIALCKAIEADDLEEIDRLVADGADANALGKGNMTPLLWAFPENHPERFKRILEHGGDPNVLFESDFNTRMSIILPGDSITHLVCDCYFPHYFDYVFEHGGDPNLVHPKHQEPPIFPLLRSMYTKDKAAKLKRLIELGADLEANRDNDWKGYITPVHEAKSCFGQYDLALLLLEAGADYMHHPPDHSARLIHGVEGAKRRLPGMSEKQREDYYKLIEWLEAHGESIEEAAEDKKRWRRWRDEGTFDENMAREVAELKVRLAQEKAEKKEEELADTSESR